MATPITVKPAAPSVGQKVDADVAALKARVSALETSVVTFVKTNWGHFVTWAAIAAPYVAKHFV